VEEEQQHILEYSTSWEPESNAILYPERVMKHDKYVSLKPQG
jgi:hypothetical protein